MTSAHALGGAAAARVVCLTVPLGCATSCLHGSGHDPERGCDHCITSRGMRWRGPPFGHAEFVTPSGRARQLPTGPPPHADDVACAASLEGDGRGSQKAGVAAQPAHVDAG